jgi:hypothetical protein
MTEPTPQDVVNAEARAAIAARQAAEYQEAQVLADEALGEGWKPWMRVVLIDVDHRRNGQTQPIATVYKFYRDEERLTANSAYVRRMPDGTLAWHHRYEPLFGDLLTEKHPTKTIEVRGEQVPGGRWDVCWSALELYTPMTAVELAEAREKREARAVEKMAEESPLFGDAIRERRWRPEKGKRIR